MLSLLGIAVDVFFYSTRLEFSWESEVVVGTG